MRIEIARLDFPMLRTQGDFEHGRLPESLVEAQGVMISAQHLAVFFPLWHGTTDRRTPVRNPQGLDGRHPLPDPDPGQGCLLYSKRSSSRSFGLALEYRQPGFPRKLLTGRSARLVVTMGMPALIYRWYFRAHGVRGLERFCPTIAYTG